MSISPLQELSGFFDVEEVGIFTKILRCLQTTGLFYLYIKLDNIVDSILDVLQDDIKKSAKEEVPFKIEEMLKTFLFPNIMTDAVKTGIIVATSKNYNALNTTLTLAGLGYSVYRVNDKFSLVSVVRGAS